MGAMLKTNDISADVQDHLRRVFVTLALGVLVAAAGAGIHVITNLGGLVSTLLGLGCLVGLYGSSSSNNLHDDTKRIALYCGFTFFQGMSIGGLINTLLFIDPSIIPVALGGTCLVFACFAGAAMLAKRRSW